MRMEWSKDTKNKLSLGHIGFGDQALLQSYLQGVISIHHPAVCPGRYYQKPGREKSKKAAQILEDKLHASRDSAHAGEGEQQCPVLFLKPGQRQGSESQRASSSGSDHEEQDLLTCADAMWH